MLISLALAKASIAHTNKLGHWLLRVCDAGCEVFSAAQNMRRAAQRRYPFLET